MLFADKIPQEAVYLLSRSIFGEIPNVNVVWEMNTCSRSTKKELIFPKKFETIIYEVFGEITGAKLL